MKRPGTLVLAIGLAALIVQPGRHAVAQTHDAAAGETLFQEGRRLMRNREFGPACAKLEESYRLDPATGTLLNLAECEEQLGRTATAWQHWRTAADQMPSGDKRRSTAIGRAAGLEKNLARLTITLPPSAPPNAVVKRDGVALGAASLGLALPVDPGNHMLVVIAPGREKREVEVSLRAREQRAVVIEVGAASEPAPSAAIAKPSNPSPAPDPKSGPVETALRIAPTSEPSTPTFGYALLGAGALGLGAGVFFMTQAMAARLDASAVCPDVGGAHRCLSSAGPALERDKRNSLLADISTGAGLVAVGAGLYVVFKPRRIESSATTASFVPLSGGGELRVRGSF